MTGMIWISTAVRSACAVMYWRFSAEETDKAVRVEFFGDEIDRLVQIDTLTGEILCELNHIAIFPASHYVVPMDTILKATGEIEKDMEEQVKFFKARGKTDRGPAHRGADQFRY